MPAFAVNQNHARPGICGIVLPGNPLAVVGNRKSDIKAHYRLAEQLRILFGIEFRKMDGDYGNGVRPLALNFCKIMQDVVTINRGCAPEQEDDDSAVDRLSYTGSTMAGLSKRMIRDFE
jgi:hypothetical protein